MDTKRKVYAIFTANICMTGGMQCWMAGKTHSLEQLGWEVFVFFSRLGTGKKAIIPSLDKYLNGRVVELRYEPSSYPSFIRKRVLNKLLGIIGKTSENDTVYIESQAEDALWAEMLASRLGGKHFFFICNEKFRKPYHNYDDYMDFYDFKHIRKEMAGEVPNEMQSFFGEYKLIKPEEQYVFMLDEDPVQDVTNNKIDRIKRVDWNICYIGRAQKEYVPNIYRGVSAFAKNNPSKKIQFIILGDTTERRELIDKELGNIPNLYIIELGNVVPIPKSLFEKLDVVIAGSGSARCSVYEGVPTILASPRSCLSSGLLGYDTKDFLDSIDSGNVIKDTFDNQLNRVLVEKEHTRMKFEFIPKNDPMTCTLQNLELFANSEQSHSYYPQEKLLKNKNIPYYQIIELYVKDFIKTCLSIIS